jgi:hypothetical protein
VAQRTMTPCCKAYGLSSRGADNPFCHSVDVSLDRSTGRHVNDAVAESSTHTDQYSMCRHAPRRVSSDPLYSRTSIGQIVSEWAVGRPTSDCTMPDGCLYTVTCHSAADGGHWNAALLRSTTGHSMCFFPVDPCWACSLLGGGRQGEHVGRHLVLCACLGLLREVSQAQAAVEAHCTAALHCSWQLQPQPITRFVTGSPCRGRQGCLVSSSEL